MELSQIVGANIRVLRRHRGLNQEQMAKRLHSNPATLSRWESGLRAPDIRQLAKVAGILGVEPASLLSPLEVRISPVVEPKG